MARTISVQSVFDIDVEGFWENVLYNEDCIAAMYGGEYELQSWNPDTGERRVRVTPNAPLPPPLKVGVIEEGLFNAEASRYDFKLVPAKMANRIDVRGNITATPMPDGRCVRTVTVMVELRILGGKVAEAMVESTLRQELAKTAATTNEIMCNAPRRAA